MGNPIHSFSNFGGGKSGTVIKAIFTLYIHPCSTLSPIAYSIFYSHLAITFFTVHTVHTVHTVSELFQTVRPYTVGTVHTVGTVLTVLFKAHHQILFFVQFVGENIHKELLTNKVSYINFFLFFK